MLASGRWDDAKRLAHTVKGLCGSLGASQLPPMFAALESALAQRQLETSLQQLEPVKIALAMLTKALAPHLAVDSEACTDPGASDHAPRTADPSVARSIAAGLTDLRRLLAQNDSEASTLWASMQPRVADYCPRTLLQKMTHALEQYDFDQALALVGELERLMGPGDDRSSGAAP